SSGYGCISETIASRTASSRPPARLSTPAATLGIGCSAKPDAFDPCAPIPGSKGSATNQVGIRPQAGNSPRTFVPLDSPAKNASQGPLPADRHVLDQSPA